LFKGTPRAVPDNQFQDVLQKNSIMEGLKMNNNYETRVSPKTK
jgi:hypothetical protein